MTLASIHSSTFTPEVLASIGKWEAALPTDDCDTSAWLGDTLQRITLRGSDWSTYTNHLGWEYPFRTNDPRIWTEDDEVLLDGRSYDERACDADSYAALLSARTTDGGYFTKPAVPSKRFDYVLLPKRKFDGWFPRGRTHIIADSSGVGKSRLTLAMLETQLESRDYLGHKSSGLDFIAIYADRGRLSNEEMLITMGLEKLADRIEHISVVWGATAADAIKEKIESRAETPAIVFVEGADMLVEDVNSMKHVAPFMSKLNRLAEHYHIALILSLGAGKSKVGNAYKQARDKPFGSSAFARMADSVNVLEFDGDADGDDRVLIVVHRGDKMERFNLRFDEHTGRLVERVGYAFKWSRSASMTVN
jgi:hypothetical protein